MVEWLNHNQFVGGSNPSTANGGGCSLMVESQLVMLVCAGSTPVVLEFNMIKDKSIFPVLNNHVIDYPTPINLNYLWTFGFSAAICLVVQIITGIFLAMHYTPQLDLAFLSVEHIMRDVNNGWFIRYLHANGASMFFIMVYIHIARGLYYSSFATPRHWVWISGVLIFFAMMATAFIGYVLP